VLFLTSGPTIAQRSAPQISVWRAHPRLIQPLDRSTRTRNLADYVVKRITATVCQTDHGHLPDPYADYEAFRDLKSERDGLGFSASQTRVSAPLAILLLIGALARLVLWLVGQIAPCGSSGTTVISRIRGGGGPYSPWSPSGDTCDGGQPTPSPRDTWSRPWLTFNANWLRCMPHEFVGSPQLPTSLVRPQNSRRSASRRDRGRVSHGCHRTLSHAPM
jgi:hypothetical protein